MDILSSIHRLNEDDIEEVAGMLVDRLLLGDTDYVYTVIQKLDLYKLKSKVIEVMAFDVGKRGLPYKILNDFEDDLKEYYKKGLIAGDHGELVQNPCFFDVGYYGALSCMTVYNDSTVRSYLLGAIKGRNLTTIITLKEKGYSLSDMLHRLIREECVDNNDVLFAMEQRIQLQRKTIQWILKHKDYPCIHEQV